jgi:hypothetical protein
VSSTRTTPPRTVEHDPDTPANDRLAAVASGAWAVVQGSVLSFAVVLLLTVVAMLGAPDAAGQVPWGAAGRVAGALWLLGHGVPVAAGGGSITLVPLGIGALALFTTYVSAKRSAIPAPAAVVAGAVTYMLLAAGLAVAAGEHEAAPLALAVLGGLAVGGGGVGVGVLAQPEAPRVADVAERFVGFLPPVLRLGVRAGFVSLSLLTGVSALLVAVWVVAGRATADDVATTLAPGWIGGIVLAVAQTALVPNLVLWASAWIAGPGFAVGAGTSFSPRAVVDGPLPALPLLGALPGADWSGPGSLWVPAAVVVCGAAGGWFAWRRLEPALVRWADVGWVLLGTTVTAGLATAALQLWAGGAVGSGRLAQVGADPWVTGTVVALEALLGAALVVVPAHAAAGGRAAGNAGDDGGSAADDAADGLAGK